MKPHSGILVIALLAVWSIAGFSASAGSPTSRFNRPGNSRYTNTMKVDSSGVPRALYNLSYSRAGLTAEQIAISFIQENARLLHVLDGRSVLKTDRIQTVAGGSHIRLSQIYSGIPVQNADIIVSTNRNNQVVMVVNNFKNDISLASTTPSITAQQALQSAAASIHKKGKSIGKEDNSQLVVYQAESGGYYLAYRVSITTEDPPGDWEVFVDALTGTVIRTEDIFEMHAEGRNTSAYAFVYLPDPLTVSRHRYKDQGFSDNNDSDSDSLTQYRSSVQLDSLTYEGGVYKLNGPWCKVTDIESPVDPPSYSSPTLEGFRFTRSQQGFEATSVYYHVSTACRYLEQLGFSSDSLRHIRLDPHGFQGQDNSHYSPSGNWISFGTGGVDDAEDATTIWHEYGHAIQHAFVPDWGGGESGVLGEGFGDYWAGSYARTATRWSSGDEQYNWVFAWDGHNPFWPGRVLNSNGTYPFGAQEIHIAGQTWSSALMGIWGDLGKEVTDRLVLKSLFYLGYGATGPDNAQALLQADRDLYGGTHFAVLLYWLGTVKHFVNASEFLMTIAHSPVGNLEEPGDSIAVQVNVDSHKGPRINSVKMIWGRNGAFTDSTAMHLSSETNAYKCSIPFSGKPTIFQYFIRARDEANREVEQPNGAPWNYYAFQAGIDSEPPEIIHAATSSLSLTASGAAVRARITDNMFVDVAWLEYSLGDSDEVDTVEFSHLGNDIYEAWVRLPAKALRAHNMLSYRIFARDRSTRNNVAVVPAAGSFTTRITRGKGVILLVDDSYTQLPPAQGTTNRKSATAGDSSFYRSSAQICRNALTASGFIVQQTTFATLDTALLSSSDALILIGGANPSPFDNPAKRSAITSFVQLGGKVAIEGGEVGHFYRKINPPGKDIDPYFRDAVLHISTFVSDGGLQNLTPSDPQHRFWNFPHAIRGSISLATSTPMDQDIVSIDSADGGTTIVGTWSDHTHGGGIIVHSDERSSGGGNSVYFTFCFTSISDSNLVGDLVSNAVDFLLSPAVTSADPEWESPGVPQEFALAQNYPNPFNPSTQIRFSLPEEASVTLKVYNIVGQEISTLVNVMSAAGMHSVTWDGTNAQGQRVSSGVYIYRLESKAVRSGVRFVQVKKMVLAR